MHSEATLPRIRLVTPEAGLATETSQRRLAFEVPHFRFAARVDADELVEIKATERGGHERFGFVSDLCSTQQLPLRLGTLSIALE